MTRETGVLVDWHDARGFGFIRRPGGLGKIYVHMKSIGKSVERPKPGDRLSYEVARGSRGRPEAINVNNLGAAPAPPPDRKPRPELPPHDQNTILRMATRVIAAAAILGLIAANLALRHLPLWVGALYLIGGVFSFLIYRADKIAAQKGNAWREPERRLHLADLTFGIVGGLFAQHVYRHKTYKRGFVAVTSLIAALHVLILGLTLVGVYAPGTVGDFFRAIQKLS